MQVGTGQRKGAAFPLSPIPWGDCMRIKLKGLLCGCTVSGIVFYALAAMAGASAVVDLLERPAVSAAVPSRAVLLDVTTAGKRLVAVGERGVVVLCICSTVSDSAKSTR